MRKLLIAFSLPCAVFAQQLQATILKNEVLPYDQLRRRVVVDVNNPSSRLIGKVVVVLYDDGSSAVYRQQLDFANSVKRRQANFEVKNETTSGPWHVVVEEAWSGL